MRIHLPATLMLLMVASTSLADDEHPKPEPHRWIGTQMDIGFPSGLALGLVFRPVDWMRLHIVETYNTSNAGFRSGITLDPLDLPGAPTLTLEGGAVAKGKLPGVVMPRFSYNYISLLFGLEFGRRDVWRFFIQGGPTWAHVDVDMQSKFTASDSIQYGKPIVNGMVPTLKLGFTFYFK